MARLGRPPKPRGSDSILYCMDRAFGHDWEMLRWDDGNDIHRGPRTIFQYLRRSRCVRCGSVRAEVFETANRNELVKVGNRYEYSPDYATRQRLAQSDVWTTQWKANRSTAQVA